MRRCVWPLSVNVLTPPPQSSLMVSATATITRSCTQQAASASASFKQEAPLSPPQPPVGDSPHPRFVVAIISKYPELVLSPFSQIVAAWSRASSSEMVKYIGVKERHALNGVLNCAWLQTATSYTAAHWAAMYGFVELLELIANRSHPIVPITSVSPEHQSESTTVNGLKVLLSTRDHDFNLPIHCAAKGGQVEAFQYLLTLLRNNPHYRQRNRDKGNPLDPIGPGEGHKNVAHLAAQFGHQHLLEMMLQDSELAPLVLQPDQSNYHKSVCHLAAQGGSVGTLAWLHSTNLARLSSQSDKYGRTIAHYAAESGRLNVLEWMRGHPEFKGLVAPDISGPTTTMSPTGPHLDEVGASPLHYAARSSRVLAAVKYLHQECGLSFAATDNAGRNVPVWCIFGGRTKRHIEVLEYAASCGKVNLAECRYSEGGAGVAADDSLTLYGLAKSLHGAQCQMLPALKKLGIPEE